MPDLWPEITGPLFALNWITSDTGDVVTAKNAPPPRNLLPTAPFFPPSALRPLTLAGLLTLWVGQSAIAADDIQFNTDVLDVHDRALVDLSRFSQAGYVMPGTYTLALEIGQSTLPEQPVVFLVPDDNPKGSEACLPPETVKVLSLTASATRKLTWWHNGQCLDPASLPGMSLEGDLGRGVLHINLPQAYLEYTSQDWDPPSRWDEGVAGMLFDYNTNAQAVRQHRVGSADSRTLSGNGVTGVNVGPWRLRADWQAQYDHSGGGKSGGQPGWSWSRYYVYRDIRALRAKLTMGEDYLNSGLFDSFRYTGAGLVSDDSMLPPNLRGYAPEVTGVAKTNAKVTISQQGRVIYETTVAAGPFRIQDLNDAISGKLDVKVQEQDGSVKTFQVDTASVPYLTRPGLVRYKFATGKPSDYGHHSEGSAFATGEFSWGVRNGWSLYGGGLFAGNYNALAVGVGRDLLDFGALAFDVTQARAQLAQGDTKQGGSYRVSYSKHFDATNSQVTFAGYRFSERNFMSMSQYLDARDHSSTSSGNGKELYTINFNQQLNNLNMTVALNYSHQTYWDRPASDTWNLTASRYFDFMTLKNLSLSLSAYRSKYNGISDDGLYLGMSIPWGDSGTLSYDSSLSRDGSSHNVGYQDRIDENNSYHLSAGVSQDHETIASGYLSHNGSLADMTTTARVEGSQYSAIGASLSGGMTATAHGVALHRAGMPGGTRMMVDTGGVSGVPVRGFGASTRSNIFGKAVVADVSSYYRNSINVDLDALGDDVEATRSVVQDTLTEGAIGYRKFGVIAGQKAMAIIRLADGSVPPFGSIVLNAHQAQAGMVSDAGAVWLAGINPGEQMQVIWDGEVQCVISLPQRLPKGNLLLPCQVIKGHPAGTLARHQ